MSIQPVVGLPGVYPPKLSVRREIFLHPDRVSYRYSGRFLHKHAKDWESLESPDTLKAGTLLALAKLQFPGDSQAKLYWFPFVLTARHMSDTNAIILPEAFQKYAYLFRGNCRFTRITMNPSNYTLSYTHVTSNGNVNVSGDTLEILFNSGSGINPGWASNSLLVFWGLEGPSGNMSPFDYISAFSILPGDTLVTDSHTQLHHYPWSGIVKGNMIYLGGNSSENVIKRRIVKAAAAAGLTGLIVDEATFE